MAELRLPPLAGVLRADAAEAPPLRWQRALRERALPEGLLAVAWTLSGLAGLAPAERRALALVLLAVLAAEAQGSTGLDLAATEAHQAFGEAFGEAGLRFDLLADPALRAFVGGLQDRGPLVQEDGRLASRRLAGMEQAIASAVQARVQWPPAALAVDAAVLDHPVALSAAQQAAVRLALSRRLALVTGGPGTGKTSIVVAILRAALREGGRPADLALAAPTGKAAHRLAAAVRATLAGLPDLDPRDQPLLAAVPQTLHRLLGALPAAGRFRHHAGNPLALRLVLVDEASMVDAELMAALLQAMPAEAGLVLLGDADQLPSVEPGTVFRDLVAALPEATVRLDRSWRMEGAGAAVLAAARRILDPAGGTLLDPPSPLQVRAGLGTLASDGIELLDLDDAGLRAFLDRWRREVVEGLPGFADRIRHPHALREEGWEPADRARLDVLFAHADAARILCPVKEAPGLRGVAGLNAHLHAQVLAERGTGLEKRLAFALGEPVLMTRNDYRRGIFNGDQGLMLLVRRGDGEPRLEAVFPTAAGYRAFPAGPLLGELELAYALTVHKAQGTEVDRLVLVLPEQDSPLASREVVYTAITRARRAVAIIGPPERLQEALARRSRRSSSLAARLADGQVL